MTGDTNLDIDARIEPDDLPPLVDAESSASQSEEKKAAPAVGIQQLPDRHGLVIAGMRAILAARVLRDYMDPSAQARRETYRRDHRSLYWTVITRPEESSPVEWHHCYLCLENTWCMIGHAQGTTKRLGICERCFLEDTVETEVPVS